ncbi:TPA: DNA polymerase III subunit alpha [Vibrio cholerae]|uniref:DNA polymerase III subunit alpha n=106 Tax=Gammaproteobacteria TaxID=1236 RepID=DPO3A_VIBCH|nr:MULTISPECIES: DNA polymerase III subunit alpha [Vibrio]P52022.3 RecName: Full=DNA polymerase III subunit alpha [Vibrio cholerae O1 biovar El Tor str. N16961]EEY52648.1 DNA polymerase III alpha subunit [Vibrio cholerae CT 5369-93]MDG6205902.1 DNA polymerase III subunit alpha [Vibrio sp. NO3-D2]ACQ60263.1 DNA polymerase III alpha subunit [Vibrio cholerae MJ-1236]AFC59030.1 DNA polymerase III subunit alpha [Vibrio cholerae IEC224]AIT30198.1 DNA polymerase III subunit alpha [Vibrio cholerae]
MSDPKFIHLRIHSDFSMVDGLSKVPPLVKKVAAMGMPAMALTDFTNLCGLVKFYSTAHNCGVKPIIGADFTLQSEEFGDELTKLTLLAKNNVGYKNLTLLISKAYLRGHVQHQPVIDKAWLVEHAEGLIVLSGGKSGEVGRALLKGNQQQVERCIEFYQTHFADHFYLELIRTGRADEESYLHFALDVAEQYDLPVVATNEVVFITEESFEAHEIRVAIHDGYTLEDPRRPKNYSPKQYLRSEAEMCELFADIPEALANSVEIAKRCNVTVRLGEYFLPNFPTGGMAIEDFLVMKSREGLEERLEFLFPDPEVRAKRRPEYDERLQVELDVINQMGFPGYFLIVMEFIQWSKDNDIPVGPGRGSGAGSLVAYALKITDLDPLEYDLLFERFLNPERVSMPDFDVDFCMDKRDQVIDHVAEMYGRDAVSQIITFGTMAAKAVIRDVGRVLGHPFGFVDRISKLVPPDPGMTLEKAFIAEPALQELYDADEEVKELIDKCRILEGCTRNAGKHAGGVVISPTAITDFAPIYCDAEGNFPVTQFDKNDVETAGLVKFDFLGLRTLTIIDWALGLVNPRLKKAGKPPVRIEAIPLDDARSFRNLQDAKTTAVFQLESRGMKELIKRLQPDCFEDIIALVALFRPGPLQSGMVDNFIDRKHGREAISYPDEKWQHESLKEILEPTYGIILYQEQVMQIAQVLSGYTLGGADMLRRAMGKKKPEEMAKQRAVFQEGAEKNGVDGELAMKIFDLVEKFAGYGFNKSHSAAYALVSYQTLWLKTHYPAEFMAAVMTADMDNTEKVVGLVDECKNMGLTVLPPDINSGLYRFNVDDNGAIVYGIGAIKGVGEGPIEAILEARNKGGYFKDLFDFCARIDLKKVNKRVIEKLILAGALDRLGPHRAAMMASVDDAVRAASQHHQAEAFGQADMFGVLTDAPEEVEQKYTQVPEWPEKVRLEGERETLGLYLTGHPVDEYLKELTKYTSCRLNEAAPTRRDQSLTVAGLVIAARVMTTKRGTRIGLMTLDDRSGRMEVMLYSEALDRYAEWLEKDKILVVSGQVSFDDFNGGLKMSAREVMDLGSAREKFARGLSISILQSQIDQQFFERFSHILEPHRAGTVPVNVYYQRPDARARLTLGTEWRVTPSDTLLDELKQLLGHDQVELEFN